MTATAEKWHYSGDVNLEHGGIFIDLSDWNFGYANAVRVTDLDSSCGFTGACLIEHITIHGLDDAKRLRQAMKSCGCSARGFTQEQARLMLAEAMAAYGCCDPDDCHHSEVVQLETDGPMVFDGWRANKRLRGTDLEAYVRSQHLS